MANAGTLTVILRAVTKEFSKNVQEAEADLKSWESATKTAATAAAAAFAGLTAGLAFSFKQFIDAEKAATNAASAFRAAGAAFDTERAGAFATALQNVTTFGDDAVVSAQGILGSFGLLQGQTEQLLPRLADFAAMTGTDMASAAQLVGRSIQSGTNALQRQGVVMTDAQQRTFEAASETERLSYMMGLLQRKAGGAAQELANTAGGALAQLQNALGELSEDVGGLIAGPLGEGMRALTGIINNVREALASLSPEMRTMIGNGLLVATAVAGIATALAGLAVVLPSMVAGFKLMGAAALKVGAALLPIVIKLALIAAAVVAVITIIGALKKAWDADFLGMRTTIMAFVNWVKNAWKWMIEKITGAWKAAVAWFNSMMGTELGKGAVSAFDAIADTMGDVWEGTKEGAAIAADFVVDSFKEGADLIGGMFKDLFKGIEIPGFDVFGNGGAGTAATPASAPIDVSGGTGTELQGTAAPKTEKKVNEATNAALDGLGEAGAIFVDQIGSGLGEVGELAGAAMQGFQSGGPWGAIIAVFATLLSKTEAFMDIIATFDEAVFALVDALEPLAEGLKPIARIVATVLRYLAQLLTMLFQAIGPLLDIIGQMLIPIFSALAPVFQAVFEVVRGVSLLIAYVAKGIGSLWNAILEAIADVFDALYDIKLDLPGLDPFRPFGFMDDWADSVRDGKVSMTGLNGAIETLKDATYDASVAEMEDAQAASPCGSGTTSICDAADQMAQAARGATESLTNVAAGYKVEGARFAAMNASSGPGGVGAAGDASESGGARTYNFNVEMKTNNASEMFAEFKRMMQMEAFMQGGTPIPPNPRFSTPRSR